MSGRARSRTAWAALVIVARQFRDATEDQCNGERRPDQPRRHAQYQAVVEYDEHRDAGDDDARRGATHAKGDPHERRDFEAIRCIGILGAVGATRRRKR